ncbi:MAG: DUF5069 domain-containing protein [Cyanobacteria bacterium P01_H01_bin.74]
MTTSTLEISPKLKTLAKDLSVDFPRSPRETIGGYIIAGRALDKCRAYLNGTVGEYHFDCPLDNMFFDFAGIKADAFKAMVATGADDAEMATWITENAQKRERIDIVKWNNKYRYMTIDNMPDNIQLYLEDYIPENIPAGRVVYFWFDVYDLEEKRL